jgi:hypothetical protein
MPPAVDESQHVELDTHGQLVWATDTSVMSPAGDSEDGQVLTGTVEDIEGATVALRVGDGLLLLEVEGTPPLGVLGAEVSVTPTRFEIWPMDL